MFLAVFYFNRRAKDVEKIIDLLIAVFATGYKESVIFSKNRKSFSEVDTKFPVQLLERLSTLFAMLMSVDTS